jgi:hypothetical protein
VTVHWDNGWFAIAPADPATSTAKPLADLGLPAARASLENSQAVGDRLRRASSILEEHGNYAWLTEKGNIAVLNNGIEFAATYFIMSLSLLFSGGGRWFSLDYYLDRQARARIRDSKEAKAAKSTLADSPEPVIAAVVAPASNPEPLVEPAVVAETPPTAAPKAEELDETEVDSRAEGQAESEVVGTDASLKAETPKT